MTSPVRIAFRDVSVRFGALTVVENVSYEVRDREFVSIIGPSGCGKTTMMNIVAGFVQPTAGRVLLELPQVQIARAWQTLSIATADLEVAQLLELPLNAPVAEVRRVVTAPDGTVLYLGEITYRGDYIHFEMDLVT